jgi:hypothetical protein
LVTVLALAPSWCEHPCLSGGCYKAEDKCNGRFDCEDGTDEENCSPASSKSLTRFNRNLLFSKHLGAKQQLMNQNERQEGNWKLPALEGLRFPFDQTDPITRFFSITDTLIHSTFRRLPAALIA